MRGVQVRTLENALSVNFVNFAGTALVEHLAQEDWASVTFTGARHRLRISLDGIGAAGAAADFLERMPDLDLPVPGAIVADLALLADARSDDGRQAYLDIEALTILDE